MSNDLFYTLIKLINDEQMKYVDHISMEDFYSYFQSTIKDYEVENVDFAKKTIIFSKKGTANKMVCTYVSNKSYGAKTTGVFFFYPSIKVKDIFDSNFIPSNTLSFELDRSSNLGKEKPILTFQLNRIRKAEDGAVFEEIKSFRRVDGIDATYDATYYDNNQLIAVQSMFYGDNQHASLYDFTDIKEFRFINVAKNVASFKINPLSVKHLICKQLGQHVDDNMKKFQVKEYDKPTRSLTTDVEAGSALLYIFERINGMQIDAFSKPNESKAM